MARKKQSKPVSKRLENSGGPTTQTKPQGLVASIWEAAVLDEEYYIQNQKKKLKTKHESSEYEQGVKCVVQQVKNVPWLFRFLDVRTDASSTPQCELDIESIEWVLYTVNGELQLKTPCSDSVVLSVVEGQVEGEPFLKSLQNEHISLGPLVRVGYDYKLGIHATEHAFQELKSYPEDARGTAKSRAFLHVIPSNREPLLGGNELDVSIPQNLPSSIIVAPDEDSGDMELDASRLYELIRPSGNEEEYTKPLPGLKPTLHGYQRRALKWMIDRETESDTSANSIPACLDSRILWKSVSCLSVKHLMDGKSVIFESGSHFYVNRYTGMLELDRPGLFPSIKGGIACDEMGLGKTVEVLALVVANPCPLKSDSHNAQSSGNGARLNERSTNAIGLEVACICGLNETIERDPKNVLSGLVECSRCSEWSHVHCVGLNSARDAGTWACSKCLSMEVMQAGLIDSRATLIVCPVPILSQWESEIDKHIVRGRLKVVKYLGQEQPGCSKKNKIVSPYDLAMADIVLTTYDVLRHDFHCNPDRSLARSLRHEKRYHVIPTPLTSVRFWRVVVDEAQMVESSTAKATEMVKKIASINSWCVTGTPISRGLEDLFGLFAFLQSEPYGQKRWWNQLIQHPLETSNDRCEYQMALNILINVLKPSLGGVMWRSSKMDVSHEIRLPDQTICQCRLRFSKIERHFYERQHRDCQRAAQKALPKASGKTLDARLSQQTNGCIKIKEEDIFHDRLLTKKEERKMLLPLLRLRQACVHPQVGAGGLKSLSHVKTPMSMIQVLQVMIGKAKVEAEDAQRLLLSTINGLAGLKILEGQFGESARYYRDVLRISKENLGLIRADNLQILHTMYNLLQIVNEPGVGKTINDADLPSSIESHQSSYLSEHNIRLKLGEKDLGDILQEQKTIIQRFIKLEGASEDLLKNWWVKAIHIIVDDSEDGGKSFITDLKHSLTQDDIYRQAASRNANNMATRFRDIFGLQALLGQEIQRENEARSEVESLLKHLGDRVKSKDVVLIDAAAHCGACRSFNAVSGVVCEHCHFDKSMIAWEVRLFSLIATARGKAILSTEHIAEAAHKQSLYRVGVGGIGEKDHLDQGAVRGKRSDNKVADSKVIRGPSQTEKILRYVLNALKSLPIDDEGLSAERDLLLNAAKHHLDIMDLKRREFIRVGAVASAQRQILYALDELNMCRMRIKIRSQNQTLSLEEERYMVHEWEIPLKIEEFQNELVIAKEDMQKSLGTLKYLKTLEKSNQNSPVKGTGIHSEPCPVCHDPIADEVAMLPCGHILCLSCNFMIINREIRPRGEQVMKCPSCRSVTPASETAVVTKQGDTSLNDMEISGSDIWTPECDISIQGSFGSKIEAILRRVISITRKMPDNKIIVFSSWKDALDILAYALEQNGCPFLYPRTGKAFDQNINMFRSTDSVNTPSVLLLLLKQGGNGLNLQQAQHVIFVEPVMDPGEEEQAIGRVDRMGQERETFIHKFIVHDSIEENVSQLSEQKKMHEGKKSKHNQNLSLAEVSALLR